MELDPQMIQAILAAGSQGPQQEQLSRQQKMVDIMRMRGMSPTEPLQAGRRVLPNYGGVLSGLMQGYAAGKMQPGLDQQAAAMNSQQIDARKQYLAALMEALRRRMPQQQMSAGPPQPGTVPYGAPGMPPMQPNQT